MDLPLKPQSTPYYNFGQQRLDIWTELKHECGELSLLSGDAQIPEARLNKVANLLEGLRQVSRFFAFPGKNNIEKLVVLFERRAFNSLHNYVSHTANMLVSDVHRGHVSFSTDEVMDDPLEEEYNTSSESKHTFEVMFVEQLSSGEEVALQEKLMDLRDPQDRFHYDIIVQPSFQDALIALLFNANIQAVVIRYAPSFFSTSIHPIIAPYIQGILKINAAGLHPSDLGPLLAQTIKTFRPELDIFYVTDTSLSQLKDDTITLFKRIYYRKEDLQELHLGILRGVAERFTTPFFSALKEYSQKPTGIFHAMPISRGNSVFKSKWIQDFGTFYGRNMFLAETSSTTGGLDSLLQPTGPLKKAQEMASAAYGSRRTFFVTNGTSTANKIVLQALIEPGDLVLIDRDCHKSHHYGMVLAGAYPVYLDSYAIHPYSMYGAVPLDHITAKLLQLKAAGRLDKVRMLLLTNCTFDGIVYHVERVMERVLAIKPDIIFLWDEAWFAFAGFTHTYRQRTGMFVANKLSKKYKSAQYEKEYEAHLASLAEGEQPLLPNPKEVRVRVYATQSTHKTLSSFRQGSMIHIWDEDFRKSTENTFLEAYMTHTSTSPNYQMLASLDVGRRQVQFEGYEMVEKSIEMAMVFRAKVKENPLISKYFDVLSGYELIPDGKRESGLEDYYTPAAGWSRMDDAWERDEFVLDPTKITLFIGRTGVDGDTFKNRFLMDQFNIQINKTSRNTVLFMTNIGTTRGSIAYLTNALLSIARQLDEEVHSLSKRESQIFERRIYSLTQELPPLPDFSRFHASFQAVPGVPGGNLREAYFLAYDEDHCDYISLEDCLKAVQAGQEMVASSFVIPYPPGFPILVPGQVVSEEILHFMLALDVHEIHGYRADLGLRVFHQHLLNRQQTATALGAFSARQTS